MIGEGNPQFLMNREDIEGLGGIFGHNLQDYCLFINIYCSLLASNILPYVNISKSSVTAKKGLVSKNPKIIQLVVSLDHGLDPAITLRKPQPLPDKQFNQIPRSII